MPSLFKSAATFALAGIAIANPLKRGDDSCLAAVTGKAALGDDGLRKEHCASFIKTIVTPAAITVTTTITDMPSSHPTAYKRDVTVCPNEVPNYASACDEAGYKSACSVYGIVGDTTITIPATTTTKTVYGPGGCLPTTTVTSTSTTTVSVGTVTVTATSFVTTGGPSTTPGSPSTTTRPGAGSFPTNCISDDKAKEFVNAFSNLLSNTNYNSTPGVVSHGYNSNVSATYLAKDFQDYSDSINWMAGIPLGSVTFDGRDAFDAGQSTQAELVMETLYIKNACNEITWRWRGTTLTQVAVTGINHFILTDDRTQIQTNYAEFNNGVWIDSFIHTCKIPQQGGSKRSIEMPTY